MGTLSKAVYFPRLNGLRSNTLLTFQIVCFLPFYYFAFYLLFYFFCSFSFLYFYLYNLCSTSLCIMDGATFYLNFSLIFGYLYFIAKAFFS